MPSGIVADLHLHTTASDGHLTPEELVQKAADYQLSAIAITDHDSIAGCESAQKAAGNLEVKVIVGAEWTAIWKNKPFHFLAYHFDMNASEVLSLAENQKQLREDRAKIFWERCTKELSELNQSSIESKLFNRDGVICRSHFEPLLKQFLPEKKHEKIYETYLNEKDLPKITWPEFEEVTEIIHKTGGIIVLAHPGQKFTRKEIMEMRKKGLDGIEAFHPSHSHHTSRDLCALAFQTGMITTGGSDWHGKPWHGIDLGCSGLTKSLWKRFEKRLSLS